MTPHLLLEIIVPGATAQDAELAAKAWAADEPKIVLVRLTRVRPANVWVNGYPWSGRWHVELAYTIVDRDQLGLGL